MRQAPQPPGKQEEIAFQPFLLFLLAAALLASGMTLYFTRPAAQESLPTMQDVVRLKTTSAKGNNNAYGLVVEESGPGYSLRFNGQANEGFIYGKLESYDLEIYTDQNKYLIRSSGVFEEWEEAGTAELDALSVVVRDPLALLDVLLSGKQVFVEEGPERLVNDVACQTYFLEIPPPDVQFLTRFEEEASLDKLQLYLWFSKGGHFMHRMALLLNVTVNGEAIQINRIYSLSPVVKELPEGLPRLDDTGIAI